MDPKLTATLRTLQYGTPPSLASASRTLIICLFYRDIKTNKATPMDIKTNAFCASGMHLPNGSFVAFGGNGAIGPGGNIGSQKAPSGASGIFDDVYNDFDGSK